jgi:hypothetical protein
MPNEILFGKPLLPAKKSPDRPLGITLQPVSEDPDNEDYSHIAALLEEAQADAEADEHTVAVIPNFQHDLESIWWLTIYTVTARVDHPPSNEFAREISQHTTELGHHRAVFLEKDILQQSFAKRLHPDIASIAGTLELLRRWLLDQYERRNEARRLGNTAKDLESYADIHNEFYFIFKRWLICISPNRKCGTFP